MNHGTWAFEGSSVLWDGTGTLCAEATLSPAAHVRGNSMGLRPLPVLLVPIIENEQ